MYLYAYGLQRKIDGQLGLPARWWCNWRVPAWCFRASMYTCGFRARLSRYELGLPGSPERACGRDSSQSEACRARATADPAFLFAGGDVSCGVGRSRFLAASGGRNRRVQERVGRSAPTTDFSVPPWIGFTCPEHGSSTANALESLMAFHAKDTLLVIDDFAPQGSGTDVARYHSAADRVFRAAGNHAGRSRLDSTAKLARSQSRRGPLILSTGEDIPRGTVGSRSFADSGALQGRNCIEAGKELTRTCQNDAGAGLYAAAMSGFVRWLAGDYEARMAIFNRKVAEHRDNGLRNAAHARTPDIVANLQAAFELYLEFKLWRLRAPSSSGLNAIRLAGSLLGNALREAAAAQAKHQRRETRA